MRVATGEDLHMVNTGSDTLRKPNEHGAGKGALSRRQKSSNGPLDRFHVNFPECVFFWRGICQCRNKSQLPPEDWAGFGGSMKFVFYGLYGV